jgi:hypothetical protein
LEKHGARSRIENIADELSVFLFCELAVSGIASAVFVIRYTTMVAEFECRAYPKATAAISI